MRLCLLALLVVGCSSSSVSSGATHGVLKAYIEAIENDDARAAYALLAKDIRDETSFAEFEKAWKRYPYERKQQSQELVRAAKADPDLGARALVTYSDGKQISLQRHDSQWNLDRPLVTQSNAATADDAIRLLLAALEKQSFAMLLQILTEEKRESIGRQATNFVAGLKKNQRQHIQLISDDRAELAWEDDTGRYRIILLRKDGEWRVDDIHIAATPPSEEEDKDGL